MLSEQFLQLLRRDVPHDSPRGERVAQGMGIHVVQLGGLDGVVVNRLDVGGSGRPSPRPSERGSRAPGRSRRSTAPRGVALTSSSPTGSRPGSGLIPGEVADHEKLRAARRATSTIPILMAPSGDPVRAGYVASLARPGGNITGLTWNGPRLE